MHRKRREYVHDEDAVLEEDLTLEEFQPETDLMFLSEMPNDVLVHILVYLDDKSARKKGKKGLSPKHRSFMEAMMDEACYRGIWHLFPWKLGQEVLNRES